MNQILGSRLVSSFPFTLVNATGHKQDVSKWEEKDVRFTNPDKPVWGEIDPTLRLRDQITAAWRVLLDRMDEALHRCQPFTGVALGGYAPLIAPFFRLLSDARHPVFTFVQGPEIMVDGKKRKGEMEGVRMVPAYRKRERQPAKDILFHELMFVSSWVLTPSRTETLRSVHSAKIIGLNPVNPPFMGGDMETFDDQINELADELRDSKRGILIDGPSAEVLFRLYPLIDDLPLFFVRTQKLEGDTIPRVVGIEKFPNLNEKK